MASKPDIRESLQVLHDLLSECGMVVGTIRHPSAPRAAELLDSAMAVVNDLVAHAEEVSPEALGRKGGSKTAERGPDYYRKIAGMRRTKGGGRPGSGR